LTLDTSNEAAALPQRRYLQVQELSRLRDVIFAPRRAVRGVYAGRHASRQQGQGVEFNDYREYTPGDEVGDIDWKVFGRSDRLYIKRFEHQTDMTVNLLVDASASMGYAGIDSLREGVRSGSWIDRLRVKNKRGDSGRDGGGIINRSKYDQACLMAGAIAFLAVRQQDRVGFSVAQDGGPAGLSARGGFVHLNHVLDSMEGVEPGGRAHLAEAIESLGQRAASRGVTVLFSDLMEDREAVMRALGGLAGQGGEVIVFHVLHEEELRLPGVGEAVFVDSESGEVVRVDVRDIGKSYRGRVEDFCDVWRRGFSARGIDYRLVSTGTDYQEAMRDYLCARAGRG
jgi:uncharacterized protein (DUF58 family)